MKKQAYNPYLPSYEYIPDGEPYVFDNRVYVYGSHDRFHGKIFCLNDYVCWSAPTENLSDWRYEGIIYRKNQDPKNPFGIRLLFAPDVVQGADGRFYLFYAFDFMGIMGVAVCDTPAGKYKFLGHIKHPDGVLFGRKKGDSFPFDPGVLVDDDKRIYLYSGFYTEVPKYVTGGRQLKFEGGYVLELEQDMLTIKEEEKLLFPKSGKGSFVEHEFFEASSIRKFKEKYYFIYSSRKNHELCYAVSDKPTSGYQYGGTLISNGDIGISGYEEETHAANYTGNNHGSILNVNGEYYIFYHRHTDKSSYSRQACAEKLIMQPDGSFLQAEMTSCGLNPKPLSGMGTYPAYIACNLWANGQKTLRYDEKHSRKLFQEHPFFTQKGKDRNFGPDQYIANMCHGATAGFKYFDFKNTGHICIQIEGKANGVMKISEKKDFSILNASIPICANQIGRQNFVSELQIEKGIKPLFFRFEGDGMLDFHLFTLSE